MSEAISIDPARGFVALPASIFDLEISPGAHSEQTPTAPFTAEEAVRPPAAPAVRGRLAVGPCRVESSARAGEAS